MCIQTVSNFWYCVVYSLVGLTHCCTKSKTFLKRVSNGPGDVVFELFTCVCLFLSSKLLQLNLSVSLLEFLLYFLVGQQ